MRSHERFTDLDKALKELEQSITKLAEADIDVEEIAKKVKDLREEQYTGISRWERLEIARHPERPGAYEFIKSIFDEFWEVYGDRVYGDDPAIIGGLAMLEGKPIVVIGNRKRSPHKRDYAEYRYGMASPEGYHKATRLMELAEKFDKPVITFVDIPGAYPGKEAECKGQAFSIARCISTIVSARVPIVACIIGEAGSGGALALGFGDKIIMLEHAFYSSISPEGFCSIVWGDASHKEIAADLLKGTGSDLYKGGVVDYLVKEPLGGAHNNPSKVIEDTSKAIKGFLKDLISMKKEDMLKARAKRVEGLMKKETS